MRYEPSIGDEFGRCDREVKCGYFLKPKGQSVPKPEPAPQHPKVYIPFDLLKQTWAGYTKNTFIQYLQKRFSHEQISKAISTYKLGTTKDGGCCFPYIDEAQRIHAVQIRRFNEQGHGIGNGWLHKLVKIEGYNKQELKVGCLFGAHLLSSDNDKPILLVESPKTAVIASIQYPEALCMAAFNKSSLSSAKVQALKGRSVLVSPDSDAYEDWTEKVERFKLEFPSIQFRITEALKGMESGLDLADLIEQEPINKGAFELANFIHFYFKKPI